MQAKCLPIPDCRATFVPPQSPNRAWTRSLEGYVSCTCRAYRVWAVPEPPTAAPKDSQLDIRSRHAEDWKTPAELCVFQSISCAAGWVSTACPAASVSQQNLPSRCFIFKQSFHLRCRRFLPPLLFNFREVLLFFLAHFLFCSQFLCHFALGVTTSSDHELE